MVGPWQVPVADCAVTLRRYDGVHGRGDGHGRAHAGRAARRGRLGAHGGGRSDHQHRRGARSAKLADVKLSANWMAAAGSPGEDAASTTPCSAVGMELCPALGIAIPVGKDSMSMRTVWEDGRAQRKAVTAPLSLIVSAFAPVPDVRRSLTPQLRRAGRATRGCCSSTSAEGRHRLGGSVLAQVVRQLGDAVPGPRRPGAADAASSRRSGAATRRGWCWPTTTAPTAACSRRWWRWRSRATAGSTSTWRRWAPDAVAALFTEELGAVLQVRATDLARVREVLARARAGRREPRRSAGLERQRWCRCARAATALLEDDTTALRAALVARELRDAALRDNPRCAERGVRGQVRPERPGAVRHGSRSIRRRTSRRRSSRRGARPRVAILREQGVNGQLEMAAAFTARGLRGGRRAHERHPRGARVA